MRVEDAPARSSASGSCPGTVRFLENATVLGRAWYKLLDAPVLTLDVTICGDQVGGSLTLGGAMSVWSRARDLRAQADAVRAEGSHPLPPYRGTSHIRRHLPPKTP